MVMTICEILQKIEIRRSKSLIALLPQELAQIEWLNIHE